MGKNGIQEPGARSQEGNRRNPEAGAKHWETALNIRLPVLLLGRGVGSETAIVVALDPGPLQFEI